MTINTLRPIDDTNWITGTYDGLNIQAQVFDEPSQYGMPQEPRISRLFVYGFDGTRFVYERGLEDAHISLTTLAEIVAVVVDCHN